ncbi:GroES-like protein [Lenzites betulinus]|nr:GroES-like protein [Lenzites betulinus]
MSTPSQQKALLLQTKQGQFVVSDRPVPTPASGEILVKNETTGLNPVDWKIQAYGVIVGVYPAVLGIDAAGTVEAVGAGVTQFNSGDRVLYEGALDNDHATFQEYTIIHADLVAKLPTSLTLEQGAALPLAITTAAIGLYHQAGGPLLTAPWVEGGKGKYAGKPIVVVGGSSVVGSLAIQLASLSGFSPIITTASLRNGPLLEGFGATHVLDRNLAASDLRDEVVKIAGGTVSVVFDAISLPETQNAAFDLLAPGGKLILVGSSVLDDPNADGRGVVTVAGLVHAPANVEFGKVLYASLPDLLGSGDLKPLRTEVLSGGLGGIIAGLERLKNNQVSARKLVVKPPETV